MSRADREKTRYYGKIAVQPNLWRATFGALACVLLASCTITSLTPRGTTDWACQPLDPIKGELPDRPCLRATLSDHNLVTVKWRVRNSRGLVYLADALGPNYVDPGYQRADCDDTALQACQYTQRVSTGGHHRWQLRVSAPGGEELFATTTLEVPRPYPPRLKGGGPLDVLAPEPGPVTWEADERNTETEAQKRASWVTVKDPATGRWPYGERWPLRGPRATFTVTPEMLNAAGEVNITARDCRRIPDTKSKLCSENAWAGFYTSGDHFLVNNPLHLESGVAASIDFTTHSGAVREITSDSLIRQGLIRTGDSTITLEPLRLTPGEHKLALRSCRGDACSKPHELRVVVDGDVQWETERDYERDFFPATTHDLFGGGVPLDIRWGSAGDIWMTREFSNSLTRVDTSQRVEVYEAPLARQVRLASANPSLSRPFGLNVGASARSAAHGSALSEKVIESDGKLWFAQGGDRHAGDVRSGVNYSRIVSFDPSAQDLPTTEQDDRFCVYAMPSAPDSTDGNNHLLGVAATDGRIWVTEMRGYRSERPGAISSFIPAAVGCANSLNYSDPRALADLMPYCANGASAATGCVETWSLDTAKPAMLELDPLDGSLWFSDSNGSYLGNFDPGRSDPITLYPLPVPGGLSWSIRLDGDAVYVASYSNRLVYRFDRREQTFDVITVPSRATKGALLHTIDIDHRKRRLWFSLSNEGDVPHQLEASTIGYIDLDSWRANVREGAKEKVQGVVYAGLSRAPYPERLPPRHQSFHGIAVEPATGKLAIATMWRYQVTELTPRPAFAGAD